MGNLQLPTTRFTDSAVRSDCRVTVIATPAHIAPLAAAAAATPLADLRLAPLACDARVPEALLGDAALLVIEVDPDNAASMRRVGEIRARSPDLPLVAAIDGASVSLVRALVREGVSDVVSLPFDVQEMLQVVLDTAARRQSAPGQKQRLAPLISVARSIGGCGATTVATQLAADLAAHDLSGRGTAIADLDLQYGSVTDFLGVSAARGDLADLLRAEDRLDEELIRSVITRASGGISVVSAPAEILPLESVDSAQLLRMIQLLRQEFGHVVLDFPPDWTSWALSAALASDTILLVVDLSVASLRQARRRLDLFRSVGVERQAIEIVVNRVEKRLFKTIDLKDVSDTLGHSILGSVSLDAPLVSAAQDQGQLVSDVRDKSRFCRDIAQIGALLRERLRTRGD